MANFSTYITIKNSSSYKLYNGSSSKKHGTYRSHPANTLDPGESTSFRLEDPAGAAYGAQGSAKYKISNPKKATHLEIVFSYQCGYSHDNYLKVHTDDDSVECAFYGKNSSSYLTSIPSGKDGQYPSEGHPLSGIFVISDL